MKLLKHILTLIYIGVASLGWAQEPQKLSLEEYQRMDLERGKKNFRQFVQSMSDSSVVASDFVTIPYMDSLIDLSQFSNMRTVCLQNTQLERLPEDFFKCDSLRGVIIERGNLKKISFPKDNHITDITLREMQLDKIPKAIRRCKELEALNMDGNRLKRIPHWIKKQDRLKEIVLNNNQIRLRRSAIRRLSKIEKVQLGANGIDRLPGNIGRLQAKYLNLGRNHISDVPASFARLEELKQVIFYENEFDEIPEEIAKLTQLEELDFYKNHIKEIPEFVGSLENLTRLFLSYNEIKTVPDTIRNLKHLRYFYIHHNKLNFLPTWITEMDSIQRLGISHNHLLELPDLSKMTSLEELDFEVNEISVFPWKLLEMPNLNVLIVRDNPFVLTKEEREALDCVTRPQLIY